MQLYHAKVVHKEIAFITILSVRRFFMDGLIKLDRSLLRNNSGNILFFRKILTNGGVTWITLINIVLKPLNKTIFNNAPSIR